MSRPSPRTRRLVRTTVCGIGILASLATATALALVAPGAASAAGSDPAVVLSPAPSSGGFVNGQTVNISVGPNSTFAPNSRIVILECAAPGGVPPVNDNTCDGNTVQYGTVLVKADGSFSTRGYTFYQLPNRQLSETPSGQPVCNASAECVLYIGQNQNDFNQPKVFSAAFTVTPSAGPVATGQPTGLSAHAASGAAAPATTPSAARPSAGSGASSPALAVHSPTTHSPASTSPGTGSPASGSHQNPSSGGQSGLVFHSGSAVLWLVIAVIVLALLVVGVGGALLRRRRRLAP